MCPSCCASKSSTRALFVSIASKSWVGSRTGTVSHQDVLITPVKASLSDPAQLHLLGSIPTFEITSFESRVCAKGLDSLHTQEQSAVRVVPGLDFYCKQDNTSFDA